MEELEGRVTALEQQMRSVRQDAAAAHVLAGGADRDVAALTARMDAQTRLMEALRQTQVEDHNAIAGLKGDVAGLKGDAAELKGGVANLARGQEVIVDLLRRRNGRKEDPPASGD
jgi:hypothetical protein